MFEIVTDPNGDGSIEPNSKLVSPLDLQNLNKISREEYLQKNETAHRCDACYT